MKNLAVIITDCACAVLPIGSDVFDLAHDVENRLVKVKKDSAVIASFVYDGDGKQVKATVNGVTTIYVGSHYEIEGNVVTQYYFAGANGEIKYYLKVIMKILRRTFNAGINHRL